MRIKCECLSDEPGGYRGTNGEVHYQTLALLDRSDPPESRMVNSFDYRMSDASDQGKMEKSLFAGKCVGKTITVDVKDFEIFNSRLKVKTGRIVEVQGIPNSK